MRAALAPAIAAALALTLSTTASAATITVNSLADTGATGICVLRDAITSANTMTATNGCVAGSGNDAIQFSVTGTIALASTLPQITASLLTINGPASPGITIDGAGVVQVMQVASGATVSASNITIANGFSSPSSGIDGGGIANSGTLKVNHSTLSGNSSYLGGAINNGGTLSITNSTFSANGLQRTLSYGGAIFSFGTLTITNSFFSGNAVIGNGGAINNSGTLSITNSTFSTNDSGEDGGAIDNVGTLSITNSTFSANTGADGAGIANGGMLSVVDSTLAGNVACNGGGVYNDGGQMIVAGSTFTANTGGGIGACGIGGGIWNTLGTAAIVNSTFYANIAANRVGGFGYGGGINNGGKLIVSNATFFKNSAVTAGGGIDGAGSFENTILAANGGGNCSARVIDAGYNISNDTSCGFAKTGSANNGDGVNPLLSPAGLASNGGPTQTIALQSTSQAIDAIPLADCTDQALPPNPIITDQRLFPRPDAGEVNCDIGAYEVQDAPFVRFARFGGGLRIGADAGVFLLSGGFKLGPGGSIDPTTQPVAFSVGSYAVRLSAGSFVKHNTGYVYQKTINGIFLCVFIKFTSTPGSYVLLANRIGGTLTSTTSPVPVTLTIGANSGSTQMNSRFN
jgi:hypothetical protein